LVKIQSGKCVWDRDGPWPDQSLLLIRREKFDIFQTQTVDGWPSPTQVTKNWPNLTWVKKFWPRPITSLGKPHFINFEKNSFVALKQMPHQLNLPHEKMFDYSILIYRQVKLAAWNVDWIQGASKYMWIQKKCL